MGGRDHSARSTAPSPTQTVKATATPTSEATAVPVRTATTATRNATRRGRLFARLQDRAEALGGNLTRTELEVISKFIEGRSPETIAEERGLSERTISNQLRTGCHKLGFSDRRELKGWAGAVTGFLLTQPTRD